MIEKKVYRGMQNRQNSVSSVSNPRHTGPVGGHSVCPCIKSDQILQISPTLIIIWDKSEVIGRNHQMIDHKSHIRTLTDFYKKT